MYKKVEKPKGKENKAAANSVALKKDGTQDIEFVDNRPETGVQQKMIKNAGINIQNKSVNGTVQLFALPVELDEMSNELDFIKNDIRNGRLPDGSGIDAEIPGAADWANDTRWAAYRKLDEWNLVKGLMNDSDVTPADALKIGFGIDDRTDPDALGERDPRGHVRNAAENKYVTGKFDQVIVNINSALNQLCTGIRAKYLHGLLWARVHIDRNSGAGRYIMDEKGMDSSWGKGMMTRWSNVLDSYRRQGNRNNWPNSNDVLLRLTILVGDSVIFNQDK